MSDREGALGAVSEALDALALRTRRVWEDEDQARRRVRWALLNELAVELVGSPRVRALEASGAGLAASLGVLGTWGREAVEVTGESLDWFSLDDAVSNFNAWIVMSGADRPKLSGTRLRDALRDVLIGQGVACAGDRFEGAVLD